MKLKEGYVGMFIKQKKESSIYAETFGYICGLTYNSLQYNSLQEIIFIVK